MPELHETAPVVNLTITSPPGTEVTVTPPDETNLIITQTQGPTGPPGTTYVQAEVPTPTRLGESWFSPELNRFFLAIYNAGDVLVWLEMVRT